MNYLRIDIDDAEDQNFVRILKIVEKVFREDSELVEGTPDKVSDPKLLDGDEEEISAEMRDLAKRIKRLRKRFYETAGGPS